MKLRITPESREGVARAGKVARLTSRGTDQESVVRVEHVLSVRALEGEKRVLVSLL